ncbi:hypothetical protein [Deinococcus arenicola]|uniref:Uncharacterized protein n=1 Tax=Deinococcus arenicola TaxID=2994950 RepID=A0ABU4DN65_9DEIO|nr:hypothetical protein [Deinococcus sp. ZS9-10]MDV6373402.1 hypothetical protein [Deinococcus sp. ZS9-10]
MNTTAMIAAVFHPIAKALKGLSRHLPTRMNRADRHALKRRRDLVQQLGKLTTNPDWNFVRPARPNAPAFLVRADARVRVLRRRPHARTGRYSFSLGHRQAPEHRGYILACEDHQSGQCYVVMARTAEGFPPHLSLSLEEARVRAVAVVPLPS